MSVTKRQSRIITIVGLIGLATVFGVLTVCRPDVLATNSFLAAFVSHEIMAFLIVTLTITFASVANIHLQITNMVRAVRNPETQRRLEDSHATPLRQEINSSAWLLFWAFVVCSLALIVKGAFDENHYVLSAVHGIAILTVTINAVVLYDIHKTIFALAPALAPRNDGNAVSQQPDQTPPA